MKLYLVRHAQSTRNAHKNDVEDAELTEIGKEQARRLGKYFQKLNLDKIYCSTLKRARATLVGIKPFVREISIKYTKEMVEHKMGIYGKSGKDDWTGYFAEATRKGIEGRKFKPKKGESLEDTYERAGVFYKKLLKNHKNDNVLVVGHGIFNLYLILNSLNLDLDEGKLYRLSNASVSMLNIDKKGKVKDFHINDFNHLVKGALDK